MNKNIIKDVLNIFRNKEYIKESHTKPYLRGVEIKLTNGLSVCLKYKSLKHFVDNPSIYEDKLGNLMMIARILQAWEPKLEEMLLQDLTPATVFKNMK